MSITPRDVTMAVAIDSTQGMVAATVEIFFVDLLLNADNAVVIARACRVAQARNVGGEKG